MSLLNSKSRKYLVEEQLKGALVVKKFGITAIPMGYIVISTSKKPTTVETVGQVDRIWENEIDKTVSYALMAQYFGMHCIYLEAGSGAEKPVPDGMIKAIREQLDIPIIVGGGIRDAKTARQKAFMLICSNQFFRI